MWYDWLMAEILLDLCCGAGGVSVGYSYAGFEVIGVDIEPQPNYPFQFIQADALNFDISKFRYVHVSPPCHAYTTLQKQNKREYPDLIGAFRDKLKRSGCVYVIENVVGAPLIDPVLLCGTMFPRLRVLRHRLFESNVPLLAPPHPKHPLVYTNDKRKAHYGRLDQNTSFVQVTGGGNATVANKADAMGIYWMTGRELNQAIPPAYTEWIGRQL
jgi:DNA (cytosine-5)-methyltransferase 1